MRDLVGSAKCVLLDFDGPLCTLFHRHPVAAVMERLRGLVPVPAAGPPDPAPGPGGARAVPDDDPCALLAAAYDPALERALTEEELRAAPTAYPTAYVDRLVRTLDATGRRLAVTSDKSPQAVECYLETRRLGALFAGHIHGREPDEVPHPKPDPHCLLRALESTGTHAHDALLIGSSPRDLAAARTAGVPFLGHGRDEPAETALREAGAGHVVGSLRDVLLAVDPGAHV